MNTYKLSSKSSKSGHRKINQSESSSNFQTNIVTSIPTSELPILNESFGVSDPITKKSARGGDYGSENELSSGLIKYPSASDRKNTRNSLKYGTEIRQQEDVESSDAGIEFGSAHGAQLKSKYELDSESETESVAELDSDSDSDSNSESRALLNYDSEVALKVYLNEIGQVPLLTPEQEIVLAAQYKSGDESARQTMIAANLRLVVKIARDYEHLGLPILDLISEGNIGLVKAVERFDPSKGGKLSTYGCWWIKQSIKRALANQSKTIRLPVHLVDKIGKMRRATNRLHEALGREATDEEIAKEIGAPSHKVSRWRSISVRPASLDAPIGDMSQSSFADIIEDEKASTPYRQLEEKTVIRMIRDLMDDLTERESFILTCRYGLDGDGEKTLEQVGEKFGITRERVRQIQNSALAKMRQVLRDLEPDEVAA
jgi:RNA polymerase primary sigma factor